MPQKKKLVGKNKHETARATFKIRIKPQKVYISVHQNFSYFKVQRAVALSLMMVSASFLKES